MRNPVHTPFLGLLVACAFAAASSTAAASDKTERTWKAKCASCHGDDGRGQTKKGAEMGVSDMSTTSWQKAWTDEKVKQAIVDGVKGEKDGKKQQMDPYGEKLKPEEIDGLVGYVRTFANTSASSSTGNSSSTGTAPSTGGVATGSAGSSGNKSSSPPLLPAPPKPPVVNGTPPQTPTGPTKH